MRSRLCAALVLIVLVPPASAHRGAASQQITVSAVDLLDYYEAGEFDAVQDALRRASNGDLGIVLDALKRGGSAWIEADGPEWTARRRLVAVTLAIETARASLDGGWLRSRELIEWGANELARSAPTPEERVWHEAALALCEGARDLITTETQLKRMTRRVPDDPRIPLGRAFLKESEYWDDHAYYWDKADPRPAIESLRLAMAQPGARDEALLRTGLLTFYAGRPAEALDYLRQVASSTDADYAYFIGLFSGWAHLRLERPADARRAFEAALASAPHARTATLYLITALYISGERAQADRILEQDILKTPDSAPDPWVEYGYGDLRRFPRLLAQLRGSFQ